MLLFSIAGSSATTLRRTCILLDIISRALQKPRVTRRSNASVSGRGLERTNEAILLDIISRALQKPTHIRTVLFML
jgi:hypothetical protein